MSARRAALWGLAALVVVAGGLVMGLVTAPGDGVSRAPGAEGPHAIALPKLSGAADLPQLHREATVTATTAESTGGLSEGSGEAIAGEGETYVPPEEGSTGTAASGESGTSGGSGGGSSGGGGSKGGGGGSGGGGVLESG